MFDADEGEAQADLALASMPAAPFADEYPGRSPYVEPAVAPDDPRGSAFHDRTLARDVPRATPRAAGEDATGRYARHAEAGEPDAIGSAALPGYQAESRSRLAAVPLAVTLIVGLLLGFGLGYALGGRDRPAPAATAAAAPPSTPDTPGTPDRRGKDWSEQAVAPPVRPPTAAPAVPSEAPAEPRQPVAPAVPTRGRLMVRSTPSGASVTVNGRWRGRTPLTLENLPFARYTVRVIHPGFAVAREEVALSRRDGSRTLSVRLERRSAARSSPRRSAPSADAPRAAPVYFGVLYVDSRPRGARVLLDGRNVGTTPLRLPDVPIGSHVVRLELQDHRAWTSTTRIAAGQEARVTGSLERNP